MINTLSYITKFYIKIKKNIKFLAKGFAEKSVDFLDI